jgi:hypothetical protein
MHTDQLDVRLPKVCSLFQPFGHHQWRLYIMGMNPERRDGWFVLGYGASLLVFFACLAAFLIRGRFSMKLLLVFTAAACVALALIVNNWIWLELPD